MRSNRRDLALFNLAIDSKLRGCLGGTDWARSVDVRDPFLGRTKASLIYRRTKNLRAVQLLLGSTASSGQYSTGIGFHAIEEDLGPDLPFKNAWCDECNEVLAQQGNEWNDVSEGYARPLAICEGCFDEIEMRNS